MSEDNQSDGYGHYANGSTQDRSWFVRQWQIWPKRADERCTTNISFLYGGVLAHRSENKCDPVMSKDYREHVAWLDKHQ